MQEEQNDFLKSANEDNNTAQKSTFNFKFWKNLFISFKFSIIFSLFFLVANIILITYYIVVGPGWGSIILFLDYAVPINFPGFIVSTILGFELGDSLFFAAIISLIFYLLIGLLIDLILHISKKYTEKIAK